MCGKFLTTEEIKSVGINQYVAFKELHPRDAFQLKQPTKNIARTNYSKNQWERDKERTKGKRERARERARNVCIIAYMRDDT